MPRKKSQVTDEVTQEESQVTDFTTATVMQEGKVIRVYTLESDGEDFKVNAETFVKTRDDSYSVVLS